MFCVICGSGSPVRDMLPPATVVYGRIAPLIVRPAISSYWPYRWRQTKSGMSVSRQ